MEDSTCSDKKVQEAHDRIDKLEKALAFYVENEEGLSQVLAVFLFIKDALFMALKKLASATIVGGSILVVSMILLSYEPVRKIVFMVLGIKDD